jgi:glutaconyl-CoA/methylmalonyl-CoA decarboxylase subunit gamma
MKSYKIKVNGKSYDVSVEETGGTQPAAPQAPAARTAAPRPAEGAPKSAPTAAAVAPAAPPAAAKGGEVQVRASMPGTLMSLKVQVGQAVKAGEVILILEAMKMENEIVAPVDGILKSFAAKEGASVSTGDVLATIG